MGWFQSLDHTTIKDVTKYHAEWAEIMGGYLETKDVGDGYYDVTPTCTEDDKVEPEPTEHFDDALFEVDEPL